MSDGDYQRWLCEACGYIYDEAQGDPDSGLAPGTRYDDIPDDWQCPLCGLRKADLVPVPEPVAVAPRTANRAAFGKDGKCRGGDDYVVIVGGGVAGWSVAEAIRRRDPEQPVLLVSACPAAVYPKPALSMAIAHGKSADDLIDKDGATRAAELGIDLRTDTRVLKLDTAKRKLTTAKGAIEYGRLVLALGASQRELPLAGDAAGDVLRVNDLISYRKLRHRLDAGATHVTLLGAGLIGCEFAEDLSSAGIAVTVVDPAPRALAALVPEHISTMLETRLAAHGVTWRLGETLSDVSHDGARLAATSSNGARFDTDLVLSAAGLVPNTALAEKAGLAVDRGIQVDHEMRSSDPNVFALGDCASVDGQVFAYIEPIRRQAEAIAAGLVGEAEPFESLPPLVRVKTPSLPLTVCPAPSAANDDSHWSVIEADDDGCRMEYRGDDGSIGFALCGKQAAFGMDLYKQVAR